MSYIFVFVICYSSNIKSKQIYHLFGLLIVFQFIICMYQFFILHDPRPNGTLQNNNHVNYLLVSFIVVTFVIYRNYLKIFLSASFLLFMNGMGGVISVLISLVIYVFFELKGKKKIFFSFIIFFAITVSTYFLQDRIHEQMKVLEVKERIDSGQSGGDGGSLVWRIVTWTQHIEYLQSENSLLLGFGIDTSSSVSPYSTPVSKFDPHSDYVLMIIDFGLFGSFLIVCYLLFIMSFTFIKRKKSPIFECQFYLMVALMSGAVVGNIVTQSTLMLVLFSLFGCLYRELKYDRF
ncbi:O-antigen ligase family protein [Vibrio antiquarius]|uniref:O-antigen ligase family protein n=2 Tax=Vibrio antiquarius (strain Ex25) TaxID=150340 RepID=UPI002659135A|nr:O-antigen ligase family protein [Vibrio antiquarius]MCR9619813.1 O-antigen ligase family protein [Vibrio antiquarius]